MLNFLNKEGRVSHSAVVQARLRRDSGVVHASAEGAEKKIQVLKSKTLHY